MTTSDAVLDFRVPPRPQSSRAVRVGAANFGEAHGVPQDDLAPFLTALGEALANAIEHAGSDGPIVIELRVSSDRIMATVRDRGVGFRNAAVLEPALPGPEAERGRGLPIIRRCSDIFALESEPGAGTAVVFGRYLHRPSTSASVA